MNQIEYPTRWLLDRLDIKQINITNLNSTGEEIRRHLLKTRSQTPTAVGLKARDFNKLQSLVIQVDDPLPGVTSMLDAWEDDDYIWCLCVDMMGFIVDNRISAPESLQLTLFLPNKRELDFQLKPRPLLLSD